MTTARKKKAASKKGPASRKPRASTSGILTSVSDLDLISSGRAGSEKYSEIFEKAKEVAAAAADSEEGVAGLHLPVPEGVDDKTFQNRISSYLTRGARKDDRLSRAGEIEEEFGVSVSVRRTNDPSQVCLIGRRRD